MADPNMCADGLYGNAYRGEHCVFAGDTVVDDVFGQGKSVAIDATTGKTRWPSSSRATVGKLERKERTGGHICAMAQRDRAQRERVQQTLAQLFGGGTGSGSPATAVGATGATKKRQRGGSLLERGDA